jgi:hypothetical protein
VFRFPNATPEELRAAETCIVCREEMLNEGKKLPCGHILHLHCLRSWLERQQVCPICRAPVLQEDLPANRPPQQQPLPQQPFNVQNLPQQNMAPQFRYQNQQGTGTGTTFRSPVLQGAPQTLPPNFDPRQQIEMLQQQIALINQQLQLLQAYYAQHPPAVQPSTTTSTNTTTSTTSNNNVASPASTSSAVSSSYVKESKQEETSESSSDANSIDNDPTIPDDEKELIKKILAETAATQSPTKPSDNNSTEKTESSETDSPTDQETLRRRRVLRFSQNS